MPESLDQITIEIKEAVVIKAMSTASYVQASRTIDDDRSMQSGQCVSKLMRYNGFVKEYRMLVANK